MREKFKRQIENNNVVTEKSLLEMKNKTYHNGDEIKVGDKILLAMTIEEEEGTINNDSTFSTPIAGWPPSEIETKTLNMKMIIINENQLDLYELHRIQGGGDYMVTIKLK